MKKSIVQISVGCIGVVSLLVACTSSLPDARSYLGGDLGVDEEGNDTRDVVVVTQPSVTMPLWGRHTVRVRSMISGKQWNHTFDHETEADIYYVLWDNDTHTRVTYTEAKRHVQVIKDRYFE